MISIHARLAITLLLGSAVVFGVGGWWLDRHVRESLYSQHDQALVSRAWALANALQRNEGRIELEDLYGITAALQASNDPLYFEVWHGDGSLAGRSPTLGDTDLPRFSLQGDEVKVIDVTLPPDGRLGRAAGVLMTLHDEHEENQAAEPTLANPVVSDFKPPPIDLLTVVVARDVRELNATMSRLRRSVLTFATLSFVLSALYLGWSLSRGLAPLNKLAERARELDARSLHLGFGLEALPRELAPVRDRMNDLLARVHSAFEQEQRFAGALAHELRTPIAELRMMAEVMQRQSESAAEQSFQRNLLSVSNRMQRLIESLLALRRAESGGESIELGPVAVDAVLDDLMVEHAGSAERNRVSLVCHCDEGMTVRSNEGLLRPIIGNLMSNAIEYSPPGTRVTAAVVSDHDEITLSINNAAPGLATQDADRMFEPFWRKDSAGSNATHAGLGLALARSLARALKCDLVGELHDDGYLTISMTGLIRQQE